MSSLCAPTILRDVNYGHQQRDPVGQEPISTDVRSHYMVHTSGTVCLIR